MNTNIINTVFFYVISLMGLVFSEIHLTGLEHLYFVRPLNSDQAINLSLWKNSELRFDTTFINRYFPLDIKASKFTKDKYDNVFNEDIYPYELRIHDFNVKLKNSADLVLRQILDETHPRITTTWWILYVKGKRVDTWAFQANPRITDNKLLANYEIEKIDCKEDTVLNIIAKAQMFRPGGAWWMSRNSFFFRVGTDSIAYSYALRDFSYNNEYQSHCSKNCLTVFTEMREGDSIVIRSINSIDQNILDSCGFEDPCINDLPWKRYGEIAHCIIVKNRVEITSRFYKEPCFIERSVVKSSDSIPGKK